MELTTTNSTTAVLRKPRLTDQLLCDLKEALATLEDELAYLRDAVVSCADTPRLLARLRERLQAIERSHAWLHRHREAVLSQRASGREEEE